MQLFNYKLYIFDLDGTIINSEIYHYQSYNSLLNNKISYNEYQKIFHSILKTNYNIDFNEKEKIFKSIYKPEYISGFEDFFNELILLGKDIYIITNSSLERINFIKKLHPLLNKVSKWYYKINNLNKKPHSDLFIKAITESNYNLNEIIVFEDSYIGYKSLENLEIDKIFICNKNYYYYDDIKSNKIDDYNSILINDIKLDKNKNNNEINNKINNKIDLYIQSIYDNKNKLNENIQYLYSILYNKINLHNIFFIGIGKCSYICKKIVSTWNSLGLNVNTIVAEDLFHGEFGKFNDNDIIIYLSNSGNTIELINIAKHINNYFFKKNILQISITGNLYSDISKNCDINIVLINKFNEACHLNKAPTISSVMFMLFLDSVGTLGIKKPIDYVVISACGKGIRLQPLTNYIPKFLVNIDNDNVLNKIVNYWRKYTDNFILIIDEKYNNIVSFYLNLLNIQFKIINVSITNQENAFTLKSALKNDFDDKKILITWCDIYPDENLSNDIFNNNIIFTYGNQCRYKFKNNFIKKENNGNVIGIYYFHKYKSMDFNNDKEDICDLINIYYDNISSYELKNLIDIGDMNKLIDYQNNKNKTCKKYNTRYFNTISDYDDKLIKKSDNKLILTEMKYYKAIMDFNLSFPKIYEYGSNYFIMEKINGKPLCECNIDNNIIQNVLNELNKIHNILQKDINDITFYNDIKIEFFDKVIDRYNKIKEIINYIPHINFVNGLKINNDFIFIINDLFNKIKLNKQYNLIHGDCNTNNIMIDLNNNIHFIDPRGYFGNTFLLGSKYYDYSKLLYGLSGYDKFNNMDNYYFIIENDNIELLFDKKIQNIEIYKDIFIKNNIDWNTCIYMVIIHWLSLPQYISNNILKSIGAYYFGLFLYEKYK